MTDIEIAIEEFYDNAFHEGLHPNISTKSKAIALGALLEKQNRENAIPLTLEETSRYIQKKDVPLWVVWVEEDTCIYNGWAMLEKDYYKHKDVVNIFSFGSESFWSIEYKDYGKTWLAFINRPIDDWLLIKDKKQYEPKIDTKEEDKDDDSELW